MRRLGRLYAGYVTFYERYAHGITTAVAVFALGALAVGTAASVTNAQQSAEFRAETQARNAERDELLACFDRYAAASSSSSKAVRIAAERKDQATAIRDDALNAEGRAFKQLVRSLLAGDPSRAGFERLDETLDDRDRAGRALDRAQANLDATRAENPIPSPPSVFCGR
jgi:hypothetical protein